MKLGFLALACAAVVTTLPRAADARQPQDESLVALFLQTCTRGAVTHDAIIEGLTTTPEWTELPAPAVDVAALGQVPNQSVPSAGFRRPESVRQWQRTSNGQMVTAVVATFPAQGSAHRNICAFVVPDVRSAGPYVEEVGAGVRTIGLSPRTGDLPHYQEYFGRLSDMRRARVEIFSRSRALTSARNAMHLYIGFD